MHGFNSIMLKDENGEPAPVYSVASGLDYPSSGPADVPTVFVSQKLLDVIAKHDEFVKRVNEANPPKVAKKRTKRQPKTTDGNNDNNIEK